MERAAGLVVLPGFFERYAAVDDIDDVNAGEQSIDKIARDHLDTPINLLRGHDPVASGARNPHVYPHTLRSLRSGRNRLMTARYDF
jgi:hypothetical protein